MFCFNNEIFNKFISSGILLALFAGILIGQILIPYQIAQATLPVANIPGIVWDAIKLAYDKVVDAWQKVQSGLQTGFQSVLSSLGISEEIQGEIDKALKWAFTMFKKKLLDMMADQIINWINGGGKPTFVTDWQAFLRKAVDDVGGNFVSEYLGAGFLCKNISPQIQLMLAKPQTFDTAAVCTLSQIGTNIQNFYNNFTAGGWKGWLTISETQNNIYGMYFYALDQKWSAEQLAAKTGSEAAMSAAGFLGDQVCLRYYRINSSGKPQEAQYGTKDAPKKGEAPAPFTDTNCTNWFTRTPGKVAADSLSKITGKEWDWLLQSKEYSEYIVAIADAVINRTIKEGVLLITPAQADTSGSSFTIDYSTVMAGVADYKDAAQNEPYIEQLIPQEKLLKENLGKIITEYRTNLDLLNQIRTVQGDAFNTLKNIAQNSCPLPGGATQQNLGTQTTGNCGANTCPCAQKTVETIKITAPSFGEATLQSITVENFSFDAGDDACSRVTMAKTASTTLSSLSTDTETALTGDAIARTQNQMKQIDTAVVDLQNYQKAIDDYKTAYDATQSHIGSQAGNATVATSTVFAMYNAKKKAVDSTRAIVGSISTSFSNLLSEITGASQNTATQNNEIVEKRGLNMGSDVPCSYNTGYHKTLCDIQTIKTSWDSALSSCAAD